MRKVDWRAKKVIRRAQSRGHSTAKNGSPFLLRGYGQTDTDLAHYVTCFVIWAAYQIRLHFLICRAGEEWLSDLGKKQMEALTQGRPCQPPTSGLATVSQGQLQPFPEGDKVKDLCKYPKI